MVYWLSHDVGALRGRWSMGRLVMEDGGSGQANAMNITSNFCAILGKGIEEQFEQREELNMEPSK